MHLVKRKMKLKSKRKVDLCLGCEIYRFCSWRKNSKQPKGLLCHNDFAIRDKSIKIYNELVEKTVRVKNVSYLKAYMLVKKWMMNSLYEKNKSFNPREMTIDECKKIINITKKYVGR